MRTVTLRNAFLGAEIVPDIGGGLARLDALGAAAPVPVLRPLAAATDAGSRPRPNQLACFPLLPWSNRLAGGFAFDGRSYQVAPNRDGDPYPIHGDGWLLPWQVIEQGETAVSLRLDRAAGAPFSYVAQMDYALHDATLAITLEVQNTGACALPFGLGLHPWMPRSAGVTLRAPAREVWLGGADKLPASAVPVPPAWCFEHHSPLPASAIDNVFAGWDGGADIAWPERGLRLRIEADAAYYIVYAPAGGDFFCFEPVDHVINAHNMPGGPVHNGLTVLAPGQRLRRQFTFSVDHSPV
ncbi:aldose 1-epimerase [Massilia sp. DWR3-1-1]|uniref:aldose 1-epimerase n=1 Tax=Massilia sp. DWR3-1-1 TaxID=2804559 RepID=UPI003CE6A8E7